MAIINCRNQLRDCSMSSVNETIPSMAVETLIPIDGFGEFACKNHYHSPIVMYSDLGYLIGDYRCPQSYRCAFNCPSGQSFYS